MGMAKHALEQNYLEYMRIGKWEECERLLPSNPAFLYRTLYKGEPLPMREVSDYDLNDDPFVTSYGTFEQDCLNDDMHRDVRRDIAMGKAIIKNNVFVDNESSRIATINRVELNNVDGFIQNSIISGKISDKAPGEYSSWFTEQRLAEVGDPILVRSQMFANKVYNTAFPQERIGSSEFFFEERSDFVEAYLDHPCGQAEAMMVNDAINPEFIAFKTALTGVQAFDNIYAYTQACGRPTFADLSVFLIQINYFVHEVLNVLIPKQIVLVMDSYRGQIDIPRKDYLPNIMDPVLNIPDYNNKMKHIVGMMKTIAQKGYFHQYVGNMYLKLSITPALTVINFISEYAPQLRLILALPTIDNQLLFDVEIRNQIFPGQYTYVIPNAFHSKRYHCTNRDVIRELGDQYHDRLLGLEDGSMIKEFMSDYHQAGTPTVYNSGTSMFGWEG